ncbi:hypothetical protein HOLleu_42933 [Holothuria leucospilota]|uniref:SET domain-containing protein n=1 Tax=Holothuria leucospilota TaxID=206669 RepID=A0A9Q0YA31_HOLLE|nr:hypothetical protein HOLleu_42933 [Holothuria leucospilota]
MLGNSFQGIKETSLKKKGHQDSNFPLHLKERIIGRLVNHGEKKEVRVKLSVIDVDSKPALCLFALTDIALGQELLYDYGVSNLPWIQQNKSPQSQYGTVWKQNEKEIENEQKGEEPEPDLFVPDTSDGDSDASGSDSQSMDTKGSHLAEKDTPAEKFRLLLSDILDSSNSHISCSGPKANTLWKQNEKEIENEQKGEEPEPDLFVPDTSDVDSDASGNDSQSMTADDKLIHESECTDEGVVSTTDPKPINPKKQNRKESLRHNKVKGKGEGPEPCPSVMDCEDDHDSDASGSDSQSMAAGDVDYVPESDYDDEDETVIRLP